MTSTVPYWLLLILTILTSLAYLTAWKYHKEADSQKHAPEISYNKMIIVSGMAVFTAFAIVLIYSIVGGDALWWVTGQNLGFLAKLIRFIPLFIFLVLQAAAPFGYKYFMEAFLKDKDLSVKNQFIALVVIVPVAVIIFMILHSFMSETASRIIFYILTICAIAGTFFYSLKKNIATTDKKFGLIYTVTSTLLCIATLFTVLYFIVALISLILQLMTVIAICAGITIVFGKGFSNEMTRETPIGKFIAEDGSRHQSQTSCDFRNQSVQKTKENNQ